jgi:Bifunctional DNA primase/polymerase, N-terminal
LTAAPAGYARQLGWHLLPIWWIENGRCACGAAEGDCKPGKHPFGRFAPHGVKDATSSPIRIARWLDREPRVNWAVATGLDSGLLVIDVDGPVGERSLVSLERQYAPWADLYPMQWTGGGRGGWQAFFAYPAGRTIGSGAGVLGPKLDHRGDPGYALIPPSAIAEPYRWETDRDPFSLPPEQPPDWLLDLLDPPEPVTTDEAFDKGADRYGWKTLESELALVASSREGRRNDQLNRSAHALYRLVADGRLYRADVDDGLSAAARHVGLRDREIAATLASAAKARGLR